MKKDLFRARQILTKDKLMNVSGLPNLISSEVAERLSAFIIIEDCVTKVRVDENNKLDIVIMLKADGTPKF